MGVEKQANGLAKTLAPQYPLGQEAIVQAILPYLTECPSLGLSYSMRELGERIRFYFWGS